MEEKINKNQSLRIEKSQNIFSYVLKERKLLAYLGIFRYLYILICEGNA